MNQTRWPQVKEIFEHLLSLTPDEREGHLASIADPDTATDVRELLAAHDASAGFLESPALEKHPLPPVAVQPHPWIGRCIGRFRIVRQIGEGGMGVVFEAERADREFSQRAALKIIRRGFDSGFNIERFRRERQILADLNHPNIARLIDGGATEDGLPYLVMEYVDGEIADAYCRSHGVPLEARLRLFQQACAAVDYAHRHNIIHRDIKPANILVTSEGNVKLLDFGIAKTFGNEAAATTRSLATPRYASPEQIKSQPVTPATDIYSLGVVLYEIVTDRNPYASAGSTPHEISRAICEQAPAPPSSIAAVPAGLDRIVLNAMHKDPALRYSSARELAEDVGRLLAGVPVTAKPARPRPLKRHWIAAAALATVLAGCLLARSLWLARQPHVLAVVQFENLSRDPALDWLNGGMAELLTTGLAQSGAFEVISTERIHNLMRRPDAGGAAEVARQARTDLFVTGAFLKSDANLRLDLRVQETGSGKVVFAESFQGADAQSIFSVADRATKAILTRWQPKATASGPRVAEVTTSNPEALRAYEEARGWYDRFRYPEAAKLLFKAIELDPNFINAHVLLADMSGPWDIANARKRLGKASEIAATRTLPVYQKRMLQARLLLADGRIEEAAAVVLDTAHEYTREPAPLLFVGWCSALSEKWEAGISAAKQAAVLDPKEPQAPAIQAGIHCQSGDFAAAKADIERYCALIGKEDWNCQDWWGDFYSFQQRWDDAVASYSRNLEKWNQGMLKQVFVSLNRGDYARGEELARSAPAKYPKQPATPPISEYLLGNLDVAQGRFESAAGHFEQSARLYTVNRLFRYEQLFKAAEIYFELGQPEKVLEMTNRHETPWLPALRGMAYQVLNNSTAADTEFTALRASLTPVLGDYMAVRTERLYRLIGDSYAGRHEQVIAAAPGIPVQFHRLSALYTGRAYLAMGQTAKAREELEYASSFRFIFGVPTLYEQYSALRFMLAGFYLAQVNEKNGKPQDARRQYQEFLAHFATNEPKLPQIKQARLALR